jgi:hypothetical protein
MCSATGDAVPSVSRETRAHRDARHVLRELDEPSEIVALVRLRHRIYFEEKGYGPTRPFGLDLTAHDARTRLFGVFQGDSLIGGARVVYRTEQRAAVVFRAVHAVANETRPLVSKPLLPSEEAFDLSTIPGLLPGDVHAEIGRFVLEGTAGTPWILARAITGLLAMLRVEGCPFYLYSCATTLARRYARIVRPIFTLEHAIADGIASDGFVFPKPTIAAVGRPKDAALGDILSDYVEQFSETRAIRLNQS